MLCSTQVPETERGIQQEVILNLTADIDGKPILYTSAPPMMGPKHSLKTGINVTCQSCLNVIIHWKITYMSICGYAVIPLSTRCHLVQNAYVNVDL